jgi:hypothetical protein
MTLGIGSVLTRRRSQDRIITTHVGSLPRPAELLALNRARAEGAAAHRWRLCFFRCSPRARSSRSECASAG